MSVMPRILGSNDVALGSTVTSQLVSLAQSLVTDADKARVIALVGASGREGTTTCVVSLGRHLSRSHRATTLLVDANLRAPRLHHLCGVYEADGLSDVLAGDRTVQEAAKVTAIPGLSVLTAGAPAERERTLTARLLRERVIAPAREFDFVLIDCAPVNRYQDSAQLAAACDGTILVIESGKTLKQAGKSAVQLLTRADCRMLGVFVNKRRYYIPQFLYDRL